ncbi:NAD(P)/FAD-dependent oxidoreductase [Demequina sp. TTPB684]|uniref:NAD(P)/FAD-dependent oxidoreductase n=1 Tax=unclassified Demequina TaxID=2620311 RepID=UPI001CF4007E|nr:MULTISPECIES: NAD(P)/FAD-dependent oxidoreductase [unclassified Demequina]MCB2412533.1 NAD(P)/FAD-dependent oxidoreductase [Demequina sp. TTPB684]UPU87344.1 NAD(P)/FAD-dependent oxidoreductase [Demequina sp. TMPB413]
MAHTRVLILGGGYVGLYAALTLRRKAGKSVDITVLDRRPYMTYQPFLPEAAAGSIEPRHAVVPLRKELNGVRVIQGRVTQIRHADRTVDAATDFGDTLHVEYDELIVALGSVARTLPIPGLKDFAIGFKYVEEAINLRNRVLGRIARAASTQDPRLRKRLLTFVFVGGGFAGVEAFAETEDMAKAALRYYPEIDPKELRFIMVEAMGRILPEMGPEMGEYAAKQMRARGTEVLMETRLESCVEGYVELSNGDSFEADTVVWTAGVKPSPILAKSDLPLGPKGHVICSPTLQVTTEDGDVVAGAWAAGDCAQVPDLTKDEGAFCAPSAQHAVRQARHLGKNIARHLDGNELKDYRHHHLGLVASLGLNKGVANILGVKLKGWPAWFMHRTYHLMQIPTVNRKARIALDWTAAAFFRRDLVSMGRLHDPRRAFEEAAGS